MPIDELRQRTETYFFGFYGSTKAAQPHMQKVDDFAQASGVADTEKRRRIVNHLVESGHRVFVKSLTQSWRRAQATPSEDAH
jgi:hypothetical protein